MDGVVTVFVYGRREAGWERRKREFNSERTVDLYLPSDFSTTYARIPNPHGTLPIGANKNKSAGWELRWLGDTIQLCRAIDASRSPATALTHDAPHGDATSV